MLSKLEDIYGVWVSVLLCVYGLVICLVGLRGGFCDVFLGIRCSSGFCVCLLRGGLISICSILRPRSILFVTISIPIILFI